MNKNAGTRLPVVMALSTCLMLVASAHALDATMARIKKSGTIVMGHRDAAVPFSYVDAGVVKGYSIDLCMAEVYRSPQLADLFGRWFAALGGKPSPLLETMFILNALPE